MILLTAQRQQASGEMSLLAQPEVRIVQVEYFQILIGQLMPILYSHWLILQLAQLSLRSNQFFSPLFVAKPAFQQTPIPTLN